MLEIFQGEKHIEASEYYFPFLRKRANMAQTRNKSQQEREREREGEKDKERMNQSINTEKLSKDDMSHKKKKYLIDCLVFLLFFGSFIFQLIKIENKV